MIPIKDVVDNWMLDDEYAICVEGWECWKVEEIDEDRGKSMKEYEITVERLRDGTLWRTRFWESYYDGPQIDDVYLSRIERPKEYTSIDLIPLIDCCTLSEEAEEELHSFDISTHYSGDVISVAWDEEDNHPEFKKFLLERFGPRIKEHIQFALDPT